MAARTTVVVATRDRPNDLHRCLQSLAGVPRRSWNLVVVDQSTNVESKEIVQAHSGSLPVLRYQRTNDSGLSRSRNTGMSLADGEIIAFLDDDCTVASDWIDSIEETTARYPKATLFFGSFIAAPHDWTAYYTPSHSIIEEEQIEGSGAYVSHASGAGGNMCLRRSQLFDYDAFDVCLGAGAKTFHSGEDSTSLIVFS